MKIRIVSKNRKAFAVAMSANEALKNFAKVDEFHLRNQTSGFLVEHDNGYKEFMTAEEIADGWASNGKLSLSQVIDLLDNNTVAERVDTGDIVTIGEHGFEVEKDGVSIPLCLSPEFVNAKYKIKKKAKK